MHIPAEYHGREQAFVKHTVLRHYLTRLFLIIGSREHVINYIDCLAGPWQDESDELESTSIGISLKEMEKSLEPIRKAHKHTVRFRALYIEKNPDAFKRLQQFIKKQNHPDIEAHCLFGDYTQLLDQIVTWCGTHFSFFFVDPKGWKGVIGGTTMHPLLALPKAEFLINFMYDFANRAANIDKHDNDMLELLGEIPILDENLNPQARQREILSLYRQNMKKHYQGRSASVPIERPDQDKVLYFLVYLTRHPMGIIVFKEVSEASLIIQRNVKTATRLRKQINQSPNPDLFGDHLSDDLLSTSHEGDMDGAVQYLLSVLSENKPLIIDYECWADFLEETNLFPGDFQRAMKALLDDGLVKNLDADVRRRKKHIIKPDWRNKSERWQLI